MNITITLDPRQYLCLCEYLEDEQVNEVVSLVPHHRHIITITDVAVAGGISSATPDLKVTLEVQEKTSNNRGDQTKTPMGHIKRMFTAINLFPEEGDHKKLGELAQ